ncbi:Zinc finger CCCH-type [Penicillium sp. DV-2018c]|nr:Zinc finger CCCH-type [Penicillium sp. DV-2018c]
MASVGKPPLEDTRRTTGSPKMKSRGTGTSNSKKRFNVDSPSFTPSLLSGAGVSAPKKSTAISPKAANAAPFQPRTTSSRMCFLGSRRDGDSVMIYVTDA